MDGRSNWPEWPEVFLEGLSRCHWIDVVTIRSRYRRLGSGEYILQSYRGELHTSIKGAHPQSMQDDLCQEASEYVGAGLGPVTMRHSESWGGQSLEYRPKVYWATWTKEIKQEYEDQWTSKPRLLKCEWVLEPCDPRLVLVPLEEEEKMRGKEGRKPLSWCCPHLR